MMQQQQSRRRRRRHPDILDSSSEEEISDDEGGDYDQQQQINNIPLHQQQTKHDSTTNNLTAEENDIITDGEGSDDELMNPYVMNPFNNSSINNNGIDVYSEQALLPPSVELASLSSNKNNTNKINNSTGDTIINKDDRRTNNRENIMGVQLGLTNIRDKSTQPPQQHKQHINNNLQPPSSGIIINNRLFDPYAAINTTANTNNNNANGNNNGMISYNRELEMEEDTIEFHNPNSPIRNNNNNASNIFGPLLNNNNNSEPPINQTTRNRNIPQDNPRQRLNEATSSFPCATNSYSPFPTQYNTTNSNKGRHYGENTPLSTGSGYTPSNYAPPYNSHGGVGGGVGNIVSTIKSILTSSINKLSTLYHGQQTFHHPNNNLHYNNDSPFITQRHRRPKFRINVKLFGIILGILFIFSSMVILYHAPSIRDDNNISGMDQGNVVNKSVYGVQGNSGSVVEGGASSTTGGVSSTSTTGGTTNENKSLFTMENDEVKTIVMERMKKAKQHWWNKNHKNKDDAAAGSTATVQQGADSNLGVQQQQGVNNNGKEENVSASSEQQQQIINTNGNTNGNYNGAVSSIEGLPAGVIVQTKEDGTVLIKLPPPPPVQQQQVNANVGQQQANRLNLKEPEMGLKEPISTKELHPLGSTKEKELHPLSSTAKEENPVTLLESSSLGSINDGEETMYIKLPYEKEEPTRRTLTEKEQLEPLPLQSSTKHHHTFHPPLPFESNLHKKQEEHPGMVKELKNEFTSWMTKHDKTYNTHEEKEHRFSIWRKNHVRIKEKNLKHGPCRLTGNSVFGHNLFSDLEPEEFQSKFLTGYKGPRHDHHSKKKGKSHFRDGAPEGHLTPLAAGAAPSVNRHPSIQRKLDEHIAKYGTTSVTTTSDGNNSNRLHGENKYQTKYYYGCVWWEVGCYLRKIFGYSMPGTREPIYDKDSYPTALDWRSMGAVSDVHSQGSCGACWAITAVETIESAYAINSGTLIDLSEEEVIACDGSCEMCNGGWPQNAVSSPIYVPESITLYLINSSFYLFNYSTIMFKSIMVCQLKHNNMTMSGYIR